MLRGLFRQPGVIVACIGPETWLAFPLHDDWSQAFTSQESWLTPELLRLQDRDHNLEHIRRPSIDLESLQKSTQDRRIHRIHHIPTNTFK